MNAEPLSGMTSRKSRAVPLLSGILNVARPLKPVGIGKTPTNGKLQSTIPSGALPGVLSM